MGLVIMADEKIRVNAYSAAGTGGKGRLAGEFIANFETLKIGITSRPAKHVWASKPPFLRRERRVVNRDSPKRLRRTTKRRSLKLIKPRTVPDSIPILSPYYLV
jgi:hypothetical protein